LLLAFSDNDLRAPQSFRLGLSDDGAHHGFVEIDIFQFDIGNLDPHAPACSSRIRWALALTFGRSAKHFIEFVLPGDGTRRHATSERVRVLESGPVASDF
jgi:hypothetical protein